MGLIAVDAGRAALMTGRVAVAFPVFWFLTKKRNVMSNVPFLKSGAEEETRTLTPERELDPEPSVSTNFTTSAQECS